MFKEKLNRIKGNVNLILNCLNNSSGEDYQRAVKAAESACEVLDDGLQKLRDMEPEFEKLEKRKAKHNKELVELGERYGVDPEELIEILGV